MASFTGPEIAAHLQVGHLIASHEAFSAKLELQLQLKLLLQLQLQFSSSCRSRSTSSLNSIASLVAY